MPCHLGPGRRPGEDVEAIRNLSTSAKEVGEGIGNKGLGFRSIEALTDDVRIYSRNGDSPSDGFDGYCFRFAEVSEIEYILRSTGVDAATSGAVAQTVPRYLVPRPLEDHPDEIAVYAADRMSASAAPSAPPSGQPGIGIRGHSILSAPALASR